MHTSFTSQNSLPLYLFYYFYDELVVKFGIYGLDPAQISFVLLILSETVNKPQLCYVRS